MTHQQDLPEERSAALDSQVQATVVQPDRVDWSGVGSIARNAAWEIAVGYVSIVQPRPSALQLQC